MQGWIQEIRKGGVEKIIVEPEGRTNGERSEQDPAGGSGGRFKPPGKLDLFYDCRSDLSYFGDMFSEFLLIKLYLISERKFICSTHM